MNYEQIIQDQEQNEQLRERGIYTNPWLSPAENAKLGRPIPTIGAEDDDGELRRAPGAKPSNPWVAQEAEQRAQQEAGHSSPPGWLQQGLEWGADKAASIDVFGGLFD